MLRYTITHTDRAIIKQNKLYTTTTLRYLYTMLNYKLRRQTRHATRDTRHATRQTRHTANITIIIDTRGNSASWASFPL